MNIKSKSDKILNIDKTCKPRNNLTPAERLHSESIAEQFKPPPKSKAVSPVKL